MEAIFIYISLYHLFHRVPLCDDAPYRLSSGLIYFVHFLAVPHNRFLRIFVHKPHHSLIPTNETISKRHNLVLKERIWKTRERSQESGCPFSQEQPWHSHHVTQTQGHNHHPTKRVVLNPSPQTQALPPCLLQFTKLPPTPLHHGLHL
jgi:hypothetical protein